MMNTSKNFQHINESYGFTLIELLTVIAIVSILSMVSMPLYQNYAIRTKITGDLAMMHPLMLRMNEAYALTDDWPLSNAEADAYEPSHYKGKYLMSAEVSGSPQPGTMTLTYDADELPVLRGTNTILYYPVDSARRATWACNQGTIPSKYRPPKCR